MAEKQSYFLCGIGGSGMLPLALILKGMGYKVLGSDRSYDQGRTPDKFAYLQEFGIVLFPQDGKAVNKDLAALVVSTAVEETIPDVKAAKELGVPIIKRAALLADLFNGADQKIAVAGTSGKTTVTGMVGFILHELGLKPSVMNGGVFKNYKDKNPYCSALVGDSGTFVSEADESDGSIALYNPDIAVLNNIALDHKSLEELGDLFTDFLSRAKIAVLNADHAGVMALKEKAQDILTYGIHTEADVQAKNLKLLQDRTEFEVLYAGSSCSVNLALPGEHNVSNALAAISTCLSAGLELEEICIMLSQFRGIWRRMDTVGTKNGITVIDDFAHNPDKIAASLKTLKQFQGRLIIFFQPHGFGFLKLVWKELAQTFIKYLDKEDRLYMVQPYYAGGTVDRSVDSSCVIEEIKKGGRDAVLMDNREEIKTAVLSAIKEGDRIVIMGARDDTLAEFAKEIYKDLP